MLLRRGYFLALTLGCTTSISVYEPPQTTPSTSSPGPALNGATTQAPTAPRPLVGGSVTIVKVQDAAYAVVSDGDEDAVDVVSLGATPKLVGTIQLAAGDEPNRIVADASGLAHVVLRGSGAIATIDPTHATLVSRTEVCPAPRGIAYDAASDNLYVACSTGELVTLASNGPVSRTVRIARDLRDVVVTPGHLYVTTFRSAQLIEVDSNGGVISQRTPPSSVTNMDSDVAWRTVALPGGGTLMLDQLASTDALVIVPAQTYYAETGGLISASATSLNGGASQQAAVEQAIDVAFDANGDPEILSFTGSVQIGSSNTTYPVTIAPSQSVSPYDASFGEYQYVAIADGAQLGVPFAVVQQRAPYAALEVYAPGFETLAAEVTLPQATSHLDTGFDLFHLPTIVGTACMNCHPEGSDDGHTWQFSQSATTGGPSTTTIRRTQSLRGLAQTAPYHWDGSLHDVKAICDEVFTHRMGGGTVSDEQAEILTHWLVAVPRVAVRSDLDTSAIAQGAQVFANSGCTQCHGSGTGTLYDNQDVGKTDSLGQSAPLQVPSLYDVADRAPYMHDGCAATLMDRLTNPACAGSKHGATAQLSQTDLTNLETFLESL